MQKHQTTIADRNRRQGIDAEALVTKKLKRNG